MVETSFYPQVAQENAKASPTENELEAILQAIQSNPDLSKQILQTFLFSAVHAQQDIVLNF